MTTHSTRSSLASPAGALLALALVTAACGASSATPSPNPDGGGGATPPPAVVPTPVPGTTGDPGGANGGGGSDPGAGGGVAPGNPGGGAVPVDPGPGGGDPANPEPTIVFPVAGVTGIRQVTAADLDVAVNGRDVAARVAWWSGVEPCYALAAVDVVMDGRIITLSVREGSAAGPDTACIGIAVYKATVVQLGELDPGTWTIRAAGDAAPIEITIAG